MLRNWDMAVLNSLREGKRGLVGRLRAGGFLLHFRGLKIYCFKQGGGSWC
jgi:hypothetical protein